MPRRNEGTEKLRMVKNFDSLGPSFSYCLCFLCSYHSTLRPLAFHFVDHPSLRMGNAVHFMRLWRGGPSNAVVLIDPDFGMDEV